MSLSFLDAAGGGHSVPLRLLPTLVRCLQIVDVVDHRASPADPPGKGVRVPQYKLLSSEGWELSEEEVAELVDGAQMLQVDRVHATLEEFGQATERSLVESAVEAARALATWLEAATAPIRVA